MAEDIPSLRQGLRVTRVVRRTQFVGRGGGEAASGLGGGEAGSLAAGALSLIVTANEFGPEVAASMAALVAIGALSQFYQPNLGALVFPDSVNRPWEYADKVRRLTLEKMYGTEKGDNVWNAEWNQRSINIDLRSRAP